MECIPARNIADEIDRSLDDTLALMRRFEDAGMTTAMKEDYLVLYDIYNRLQEQKGNIRDIEHRAAS
ncbi:MAG: hypothetical protein WC247_15850 [Porticoccaceae bacterium]|jgi:hypothetical protein